MATNPPIGDGHRQGAVRKRSQVYNPKTGRWEKRDAETGRIMDVKADKKPFKGVRKEHPKHEKEHLEQQNQGEEMLASEESQQQHSEEEENPTQG